MSRDKQIEEIKSLNLLLEDITVDKVLYTSDGEVVDTFKVPAVELKVTNQLANILYNAGYRKSSEVAKEILAELEEAKEDWGRMWQRDYYGYGGDADGYLDIDVEHTIYELKKKYTEGR